MDVMYTLEGVVVRGKGLGRTVGMPTANLSTSDPFPPFGVYASYVYLDGRRYLGVTNVGMRPSVDNEDTVTVETNILSFDADIYGHRLRLELMVFLRPTVKLPSLEEVREQVERDKKEVVRLLG